LEERKGITYLVQAIPQILNAAPDTEFVIIGADTINSEGGQRSVLADLRDFLARNHVADRVKFIPRVPLNELPNYYRSADICVVPSIYDNSPYTCLEAMSCGRPVVGTSGGGTKEYVTDGECGIIVPPRDIEALRDAITHLLRDGRTRRRMAENARRRVLEKFQRKQIAAETLALYHEASVVFKAKTNSMYLKPPSHLLSDAAVLLYSYDKMIYDLLYQQSYRFRVRHWMRAAARPRLFAARILLRLARAINGPRRNGRAAALVQWLEEQIAAKQEGPLEKIAALTGRTIDR
jgi:hypothetical protein